MSEKKVYIKRALHDRENPYLMVKRTTAQDKTLSYESRGVLVYLLSQREDWKVQPTELMIGGCGRDKVYRILKELIDAKYIEHEKSFDAQHKIVWGDYIVHEYPHAENPDTENQEVVLREKPFTENPDTENQHSNKYPEKNSNKVVTRKSASTPKAKSLPANRKTWQWEHIERYAVENPGIEDLAECYETGMVYTLKQLPTRAIALDCIELYEEMQRNGKNDYSGLWLRTTFKPEYSPFKCMLWALPNWLKGESTPQPPKKSAHERMIDELKALPPEEIIPPLMRFQNDQH